MTERSIFAAALDITDPTDRAAYLDRACAGDAGLRRHVEELLAAQGGLGSFLNGSAGPARTAPYEPVAEGPGSRVGPYKLLQQIGEGGMGVVYMAEQEQPVRRKVALKIIKPGMDSKQVVARFEAERQALGMMDHPNIAKVFDASTTESGRPYFVMELVHGVPITEYCDANKLTPRERLELFVPVCHSIQHAHMKGVIHRDVKPSNVLVTMYDDKPVPKVIDFGVAKAVEQRLTEKTLFTQYGALVGTFEYMSPEQAEMNAFGVDTRSDVYSLGVLLYELLTGTTPLERQRLRTAAFGEVVRLIKEEEPPRPSMRISSSGTLAKVAAARKTEPGKLSTLVRGELDWIVMRCLEKDRTRRYDTAVGLARDVERHLNGDAVEACPPTFGYRLRKAYRRNRTAVLVSAAFSGLFLAAGVTGTYLAVRATDAERATAAERDIAVAKEAEAVAAKKETEGERDKVHKANQQLERGSDLQQRTRYAAEMNLLQAAYNAKDMEQVKRLLLAQVPKPGEPDYRGPEWHYWDRKLNGFVKEFTVPVNVNSGVPVSLFSSNLALSPDGRRFAEAVMVSDAVEVNPRKLVVRVWDTDTGKLVKRLDRDATPLLQLVGDVRDRSRVRAVQVVFKNGGRDLLIHCSQPVIASLGRESPGWVRDIAWNTESDETKLLHRAELPVPADNSLRPGMSHSVYTEDLSVRATSGQDPERRERVVEVVRLADQKVLFRKVSKETTTIKMFTGGRYLLTATLTGSPAGLGNPTRTSTETLWRLDGGETPLWTRDVVVPSAIGREGFLPTVRVSRPSADGKTYTEYTSTRDGLTATRYDLETGKPVGSQPLLDKSDFDFRSSLPAVGNPGALMATDAASRRLVLASATGVAVRRWDEKAPAGGAGTASPPDCEMLDGPPQLIGLRGDGVLITVHRADREAKLRHWHLPTDADMARTSLPLSGGVVNRNPTSLLSSGAIFSRDRSHVAQVMYGILRGGPGKGTFTADERNAKPLRLLVFDSTGKKLLSVDCTKSETVVLPENTYSLNSATAIVTGLLGFSADGRYFHYVLRTQSQKTPPVPAEEFDEVVIRDLQTSEDAGRVRLDAGQSIQSLLVPQGQNRFLIAFGPRPVEPDAGEEDRPRPPLSARLYEYPTGRLIGDLKTPAGKTLRRYSFDGENWFATTGPITAVTVPQEYWEAATGKYVGERVRSMIRPPAERPNPTARVLRGEQAAGARVVRTYAPRDFGTAVRTTVIEVWDAARLGADDKPLFTIEDSASLTAYLAPDGKRLLVHRLPSTLGATPTASRLTVYCTETGRPVVSLPRVSSMPDTGTSRVALLGLWSADGRHFWLATDVDGTLSGYDFRPRE